MTDLALDTEPDRRAARPPRDGASRRRSRCWRSSTTSSTSRRSSRGSWSSRRCRSRSRCWSGTCSRPSRWPPSRIGLEVQSNAPLHNGGVTTYEGGIRVPALVRWPGHIKPGTVCREMLSSLDVLPMIVTAAGGKLPADRRLDGRDPTPALAGKAASPIRPCTGCGTKGATRRDRAPCARARSRLCAAQPGSRGSCTTWPATLVSRRTWPATSPNW